MLMAFPAISNLFSSISGIYETVNCANAFLRHIIPFSKYILSHMGKKQEALVPFRTKQHIKFLSSFHLSGSKSARFTLYPAPVAFCRKCHMFLEKPSQMTRAMADYKGQPWLVSCPTEAAPAVSDPDSPAAGEFYLVFRQLSQSDSLNPTKTKPSPMTSGRFTSIPSVASSFSISSSFMAGSLFFRSIDL